MAKKKEIDGDLLVDQIIKATFARHADNSESEFLDKIGVSKDDRQDEATEVRLAKLKMLTACTKELMLACDNMRAVTQTIKLCLGEKESKNEQ